MFYVDTVIGPNGICIFTYKWLIFLGIAGKYISPMDSMG